VEVWCTPSTTHVPFIYQIQDKFSKSEWSLSSTFNPLNTELNPICHLLALLGAHHILYISRRRVKPLLFEQTVAFWVDITYFQGYLPPRKPGLSILVEVHFCQCRHQNRQGLRRNPVIRWSSQIILPGALRLCVLRVVWTGISIIHSQLVPEIH